MKRLLLTISMLLPDLVLADPSANVRYLMNEPITALDFGLYQMDKRLSDPAHDFGLPAGLGEITATARYDWEGNRILAQMAVILKKPTVSVLTAKKVCRQTVSFVRSFGGIDEKTGEMGVNMGGFLDDFNHKAFVKANAPQGLAEELIAITNIIVRVYNMTSDFKLDNLIHCEGPLLGKDVLFAD